MNTLEKIQTGQIRLHGQYLIGLGTKGDESIDIEELNAIIEYTNNSGCITSLMNSIAAVADILLCNMKEEDDEIKEYVNENIIPTLPDSGDIFIMRKLICVFNT